MQKSTALAETLAALTTRARSRGLTDSRWAELGGVRKETLSRLRRRQSCDFETLRSLAQAVGAELGVAATEPLQTTPDGHLPAQVGREYEERLVRLCASGDLDRAGWASAGPRFFMAGLAVMIAGSRGVDRRGLLVLAEELHPGIAEVAVFSRWLERTPLRPSRFLPLVDASRPRAA